MRDETVRQQRNLAIIQQLLMRQKRLVFGHAIMAAEITPVGDRYPQIVNFASKAVDHTYRLGGNLGPTKPKCKKSKGWERYWR